MARKTELSFPKNYFFTQGQIDLNYFFLLINQHLTTASVAIYSGYHKKCEKYAKNIKAKNQEGANTFSWL